MSADAIYQVTKTLRLRLEQVAGAGKVFVGPLDDPDADGAALILFLYRIVPNPSLRNREHRVASNASPPVVVFNNSLPLDLYYLVTVGTTSGTNEEMLLKVLGSAMQALQLDPELTGPDLGYEAVHVSLEALTTEETGRIWALFPTANYRTSVVYLASPAWIDPLQPEAVAVPVVKDSLDVGAGATLTME
ncbi:DUF4255 domain-containing protein [Bradyrhizobium sp. S3.2.12]|uniref:DUF4255 domain-containing protein n=1 Tax=Bradyrhizobium sp. S3.2.12 TaxID=3156387 RepID=UPI00339151D3